MLNRFLNGLLVLGCLVQDIINQSTNTQYRQEDDTSGSKCQGEQERYEYPKDDTYRDVGVFQGHLIFLHSVDAPACRPRVHSGIDNYLVPGLAHSEHFVLVVSQGPADEFSIW